MKTLFLSFHFGPEDRELVNQVSQLMASHDILPITGQILGGGPLDDTIRKLIEDTGGLIALLTRRDKIARTAKYTTHDWVKGELDHARGKNMNAIALIETGVEVSGFNSNREYIPFDRRNPLPAFLRLSETIGQWKREIGRSIKVMILPDELAQQLGNRQIKCRYRLKTKDEKWKSATWTEAEPVPEVGGTFISVAGVDEGDSIMLEVKLQNKEWRSRAWPQWVPIELKEIVGEAP
ncbi:MAG TPA: hypothetical protein VGC87_17285 [Pyrinomonadaceae bacterium]|jgi:hypothetical protein